MGFEGFSFNQVLRKQIKLFSLKHGKILLLSISENDRSQNYLKNFHEHFKQISHQKMSVGGAFESVDSYNQPRCCALVFKGQS
jgi:hypothetical protein